jgi:hypothetical protein
VYSIPVDEGSGLTIVIPGRCESIEPQIRNCASGNLEIPGLRQAAHPGMTGLKFRR